MKIKMVQGLAGAEYALAPGDVTERFPDKEAKRLIEAGIAIPFAEKRIEQAVKAAPEKRHPFDHDGDGKPGGSLPKNKRKRK